MASDCVAYVLKRFMLSENRYIIDMMTREQGRLRFLARGVEITCIDVRSVLRPFQPLMIHYELGHKELLRLIQADVMGPWLPLPNDVLLCAFYINELLLRLTPIGAQHTEALFDSYVAALTSLRFAEPEGYGVILRRFERDFLRDMGYAIFFLETVEGQSIDPDGLYTFGLDEGFVLAHPLTTGAVQVKGQSIIDIRQDSFAVSQTRKDMKNLFAYVIQVALEGKSLKTKKVLTDVSRLCSPAVW